MFSQISSISCLLCLSKLRIVTIKKIYLFVTFELLLMFLFSINQNNVLVFRMASEAVAVKIQEGVGVDAVVPAAPETSAQRKILLKSAEGEEFLVDELLARGSKMISNMIDDGCTEGGIPLPNVTAPVLSKVLEYWKHHVGKSETDKDAREFDRDFVKDASSSVLFDVIMVANYLDCKPLLDLACQAVADAIRDMNVEQVRGFFGITNDFTPDEEAAVREENRWAFD